MERRIPQNVLMIGNSFRLPYALSEERISALQQAAHRAVNDLRTSNLS